VAGLNGMKAGFLERIHATAVAEWRDSLKGIDE
jgi:hypothetical protein